jgi:histone deacetylase 11
VTAQLVWSPRYDLTLYGLERLHPFDGRKYSRAWHLVDAALGRRARARLVDPDAPVDDSTLMRVHSAAYLESLRSSATVAAALELPLARFVPASVLRSRVLEPMRLATAGTVSATRLALQHGWAMNLGGGFHHAFRDHGEGFCVFGDVAVAIACARASGVLRPADSVAVIDLDAHRGNGFEAIVKDDPNVDVLDIYNFQIYPGMVEEDDGRFPHLVPIRAGTGSDEYLQILDEELARFLDSRPGPALAFYNAGTDIVSGDPLGRLDVSSDAVQERDRRIVAALAAREIPTVVVTSGGYTEESHRLIAALARHLIERF